MLSKEITRQKLTRLQDSVFYVKEVLVKALKQQIAETPGLKFIDEAENYYKYWKQNYGEICFDIGCYFVLANEIENGLKYYYMEKMGYSDPSELLADPYYKPQVFKSLFPWSDESTIELYERKLNYDLNSNIMLPRMQEFFLSLSQYKHKAGNLDEDFLQSYISLTSFDASLANVVTPNIMQTEELFSFIPVKNINDHLTNSIAFFSLLP